HIEENYPKDQPPELGDALKLAHGALTMGDRDVPADNLEAAVLDRTRGRRKFRRLGTQELTDLL
ncbi:MAG: proteasome subunit alpha, partial [Actinomycetota bacterium]